MREDKEQNFVGAKETLAGVLGGVRKAVKMMGTESSRADVTCTSLLRDINGMDRLVSFSNES